MPKLSEHFRDFELSALSSFEHKEFNFGEISMSKLEIPLEPNIQLDKGFIRSMKEIEGVQSKKVFEQFQSLLDSNFFKGLNLKKLYGAMEPFWSARLNDDVRIILTVPKKGFYYLVWADHHDAAYDWAVKHSIYIDPTTGAISVIGTQPMKWPSENSSKPAKTIKSVEGPYKRYSDEDLIELGVPPASVDAVRSLNNKYDLWKIGEYLPDQAFDNLLVLAEGVPLKEIVGEKKSPTPVTDWEEAIQLPQGNITSWKGEPVEKILCEPINFWRIFLHPDQRQMVENPSRTPLMVKGAAGTGKTVVAMHRAAHLVKDPTWNPDKKLLFTTFTKNLVLDIRQNLAGLCTPEELERIEVINVNDWVERFLKGKGIKEKVEYPGRDPITNEELPYEKLWEKALKELPEGARFNKKFIREEWDNVILPDHIMTEQEYLESERKNRSKELSTKERKTLWHVFGKMRELLAKEKAMTYEDACLVALDLLRKNPTERPYDAIVVDEAQDLIPEALKVLAELATLPPENSKSGKSTKAKNEPRIFLAGDGFQRIYSRPVDLKDCGINVSGKRTKTLTHTYRTTDPIRKVAETVLEGEKFGALNGGFESLQKVVSNRSGDLPVVKNFPSITEEVKWIGEQIQNLNMEPKKMEYPSICIVARTKTLRDQYRKELENLGFTVTVIGQTKEEVQSRDGIRIATINRVKGLEFKAVFIVGAKSGKIPLSFTYHGTDDRRVEKQNELHERSLFYVACSRARDNLFITSSGKSGKYMEAVEEYLDSLQPTLAEESQVVKEAQD